MSTRPPRGELKRSESVGGSSARRPVAEVVRLCGVDVLTKRGSRSVWARCPFHGGGTERTPSMAIDPEKDVWFCYACGFGGDAIEFVRRMRRCSFAEALSIVGGEGKAPAPMPTADPFVEAKQSRSTIASRRAEFSRLAVVFDVRATAAARAGRSLRRCLDPAEIADRWDEYATAIARFEDTACHVAESLEGCLSRDLYDTAVDFGVVRPNDAEYRANQLRRADQPRESFSDEFALGLADNPDVAAARRYARAWLAKHPLEEP